MRVVGAWVLAGTLLALSPVGAAQIPPVAAPPDPAARGPSTREALDRYLKGDYDAALAHPTTLGRFNSLEDADRWVSSAGAAASERRRLAAALFALEYGNVRQGFLAPVDDVGARRSQPASSTSE